MNSKNYAVILTLFLSLFVFACSKDDDRVNSNSLVGVYTLEKTGTNFYDNGKIVKHEVHSKKINGEMTLLADKSFRIVFSVDGESDVATGTYNVEKQVFTINQDSQVIETPYFFEDGYLVLVTEDNRDTKGVGYFKKK